MFQTRGHRPEGLIHLPALQSPEVPEFLIKAEDVFKEEADAVRNQKV